MSFRIGVDIGGSFADFAVLDEADQTVRSLKVFSRPDRPGEEVLEGLRQLAARDGIAPGAVTYFTHGTTVGVNAVIQRKGLALGLITTKHFEDVLELARYKIPDMYDLFSKRPDPLVPRWRVAGVVERLDADGAVETPLDRDSIVEAWKTLKDAGCEGAVVSLLHSYRNPAHEHAVKQAIAALDPGFFVLCSADVWPIVREYERTVTAVIGGFVQPRVADYLGALQAALASAGVAPDLRVTKSNGGVMTAEHAKSNCLQMILSGTAAGVIGAAFVAEQCALPHALSLDIGGTSADVALIQGGRPHYATGERIGDFAIHIPSVSVSSIGAGGGTIARVDEFGVLKVGPESAGSNPGPACYGRGGTRPTVTDAFVALGWLGHSELGYSAVTVDRAKSMDAIAPVAARLGVDVPRAAQMIVDVAVSGMFAESSGVLSRNGVDPKSLAIIAFGGAGPMMAGFLARELRVGRVVVPRVPGVLSALGGLIADLKNDFMRTLYATLDAAMLPQMQQGVSELEAAGLDWLRTGQGHAGEAVIERSAEMRYRGQSFEIEVPLAPDDLADPSRIAARFHEAHRRIYGHADELAPIQIITLRLVASGPTPKPRFPELPRAEAPPPVVASVETWIDGAAGLAALYRRADLLAGHRLTGPAIVAQDDTTTIIPSGFAAEVDRFGNLHLIPA